MFLVGLGISSTTYGLPVVLYQHTGNNNPTSEGWTLPTPLGSTTYGSVTGSPLAWGITNSANGDTAAYVVTPTPAQVAAASNCWSLKITLRVLTKSLSPGGSMLCLYRDGARSFQMHFGSDANNNAIVVLSAGNSLNTTNGIAYVIPGGSVFNTYELLYSPGTATADLFVNGILLHTGYAGFPLAQTLLAWGDGSTSVPANGSGPNNTSAAQYSSVIFSICQCLSITKQSVECIATNGIYAWNFSVTNLTTDPVGFLSFPDLPAGVTIQQDIFALNPVLQPGQGTNLTLNITNTLGTNNLCFTIGAHATNFALCCSVANCLPPLTPCCAYVFNETVTPIPGAANCYNYTLTVRNVSTQNVSYIFLVPDPYSTCLAFTPDIIHLTSPLAPGQQTVLGPIKVCIDPLCPKPLCFLVSLQNSNLVQCCASRHCLPPPINPPLVLSGPLDGTVFFTPAIIPLAVNRSAGFAFSSVRYRANDQAIGTNSIAPYSFIWSNAPPGDYVLRAEGIETNGGGVWISEPVRIYVRDASAGGPTLLAPAAVGGNDNFALQTSLGVSYVVECSATILWPEWHPLKIIVGTGGAVPFSQSYTNTPQRFYRVRVQQ